MKLRLPYPPALRKATRQRSRRPLLILGLLLGLVCTVAIAQKDKKSLERERKAKEKELNDLKKELQSKKNAKKKSLGYLRELNQQIRLREDYISTLDRQLKTITEQIGIESDITEALQADLERLKNEYAELLIYLYRRRGETKAINFILSAENSQEIVKRINLIKHFTEHRQLQMAMIAKTEASLNERVASLKEDMQEKTVVHSTMSGEKVKLLDDEEEQRRVVKELEGEVARLKRQIAVEKRAIRSLNTAIRDVITAGSTRDDRPSRRRTTKTDDTKNDVNPEINLTTPENSAFSREKGKLTWPVGSGKITERFGKFEVEGMKGYYIESKGVKFQTTGMENVKSIYAGEVTKIVRIPNMGLAVIAKYGDYFVVYSGLETASIAVGSTIRKGDIVGKTGKNGLSGEYEVGLQIWRGKTTLDPSEWIKE